MDTAKRREEKQRGCSGGGRKEQPGPGEEHRAAPMALPRGFKELTKTSELQSEIPVTILPPRPI